MIWLVAKLSVRTGSEEAFERIAAELQQAVKSEEPDVAIYEVTRSAVPDGTYSIIECYPSPEALDAHMAAPHLRQAMGKMAPLLTGKPEITRLEALLTG